MINKKIILYFLIIFNFTIFHISANEPFEFNITEIEIKDDGNKIIGKNRGLVKSNNNLEIEADNFIFFKINNKLNANGNVIIKDDENNLIIYAKEIEYLKDEELIYSKGKISAVFDNKYKFDSENIIFDINLMELRSSNKTTILNGNDLYRFENFTYLINEKLIKGKNVSINEDHNKSLDETNKFFFDDIFLNLKTKKFHSGKTKFALKKNLFNMPDNDPRLIAVSSKNDESETILNKAIFTSCKLNKNGCPPWSIKANQVTHDKKKKQLIYDDAIIQLYNLPVIYFPKFFHPDPSVERQSGFLKPQFNQSNFLGSSLYLPYFLAISDNTDLTFKPTIFDSKFIMIQNEYRKKGKNSYFEADFNFVKGYNSPSTSKKKNINHFFSKLNLDLNLNDYNKSILDITIEKLNNDTYLKVFDSVLSETILKPETNDVLKSGLDLYLENDNFNLELGMKTYENLLEKNSDRYQFIFPYYNFTSKPFLHSLGSLSFNSIGSNSLVDTNNLKTKIVNNLSLNTENLFENKYGFKNSSGLYFKNLNSLGKNDTKYKNSPQVELMSLFEMTSSYPLIKKEEEFINYLNPKISFRTNPSNINNYSGEDRKIDVNNIFKINRLALDDILEPGTSLTIGAEYKIENISKKENYLNFDIGKVFRDKNEKKVPTKSTLDKKNSHLFGSLEYGFSKNLNFNYDFAVDNTFNNFDYNSLSVNFSVNNFITNFNFIEENGAIGSTNLLQNTTTYKFDENNFVSFNTRKNRKLNLTEYYDLVYEYKNDCLIAGVKYKKTYYEDRDLKPSEDLVFSITLFPLTSFEQKINQKAYRN